MRNRTFPVVPILVSANILFFAWWLYQHSYFVEEEVRVPKSYKVRQNDWHAAALLLEKHGFSHELSTDRRSIDTLDINQTGVLMLSELESLKSEKSASALANWVESGGILIASLNPYVSMDNEHVDQFLSLTKLNRVALDPIPKSWMYRHSRQFSDHQLYGDEEHEEHEKNDENETINDERLEAEPSSPAPSSNEVLAKEVLTESGYVNENINAYAIQSTGGPSLHKLWLPEAHSINPITVNSYSYIYSQYSYNSQFLHHDNDNNENQNAVLIQDSGFLLTRHGSGYVAIYPNRNLFKSNFLSSNDNAYLLMWITQPSKQKSLMMMNYVKETPSLLGALWQRYPLVIALLALVVLGYVLMASARLGPLEQEPHTGRSNLLAHLRAKGRFLSKHKQLNALLQPLRQETLVHLAKRRGDTFHQDALSNADKQKAIQQFSQLAQCSEHEAKQVLFEPIKNTALLLPLSQHLYEVLNNNTKRHTNQQQSQHTTPSSSMSS